MKNFSLSIPVTIELEGWRLYRALVAPARLPPKQVLAALAQASARTVAELAAKFDSPSLLSSDPVVQAVRSGFRRAGTDPTRHRPSFEALARRILKGKPLPMIHPLVDMANLLSLRLHVPVCLLDTEQVSPPLVLRRGGPEDTYESLKGPYSADGKPCLTDKNGVVGTPIVDSHRTRIRAETELALLYAYVPADLSLDVARVLEDLIEESQAARLIERDT